MSMDGDPARLTVAIQDRRVDVTMPADVPLVALVPAVLRHANPEVADHGAIRGGWIVRRADGATLSGARTLNEQGVRDGDVLAIVPADEAWPDPEYDDVVEAILASPRLGRPWHPRAARLTALVVGAMP